jgi:hypothetical protein
VDSGLNNNFRRRKLAVSSIAIAVVIIVVVAAVGVGAYVVLAPSKSTTLATSTTSNSSSVTTISTSSSSTFVFSTSESAASSSVSAASTSLSSSSLTNSTTPPSKSSTASTTYNQTTSTGIVSTTSIVSAASSSTSESSTVSSSTQSCSTQTNTTSVNTAATYVPDIFGNFSQMSIRISEVTNNSASQNDNESYLVVGRPLINGSLYYEVNITASVSETGGNVNESATLWILPNGTATEALLDGITYGGATASLEGLELMLSFEIPGIFGAIYNLVQYYNATSYLKVLNETTLTLGQVQLNVTYYSIPTSFITNATNCGLQLPSQNYTTFVWGVGTVQGTNYPIGVSTYIAYSSGTTNYTEFFQVASLGKAS